jgi:hypothetical protein
MQLQPDLKQHAPVPSCNCPGNWMPWGWKFDDEDIDSADADSNEIKRKAKRDSRRWCEEQLHMIRSMLNNAPQLHTLDISDLEGRLPATYHAPDLGMYQFQGQFCAPEIPRTISTIHCSS